MSDSGFPTTVRRRVATTVKRMAMVFGALVVATTAYEQIASWRDWQVLKQVGRSVDIGGRSLNLSCIGRGAPAVIFVSGRTSPGYVWTPIQRAVSAFTEACWYDRAGLGWSDPGPDPGWGDAAARDLHELLIKGGPKPPFILVGASFGGYVIRFFNDTHPDEVAGMVFVDAANEDAGTIEGIPHRDRPRNWRAIQSWPAARREQRAWHSAGRA
jgi:pimeloyl-ACP methyl ester carboxylesterase